MLRVYRLQGAFEDVESPTPRPENSAEGSRDTSCASECRQGHGDGRDDREAERSMTT